MGNTAKKPKTPRQQLDPPPRTREQDLKEKRKQEDQYYTISILY